MVRFVSIVAALLGTLALTPIRRGNVAILISLLKTLAAAVTPLIAVAGALGATAGAWRRSGTAVLAGAAAFAMGVVHTWASTRPHDGLARAFGPDWRARIPPAIRPRLRSRRWQPLSAADRSVPWQRDIVFATHVETGEPLRADLWLPPTGVPRSGLGIVYVHGSAWHYADKDMGTRPFFRRLAGQGHVILDIAYTLAPQATLIPMLNDVKRAVGWMKTFGGAHGVDPERVALMGGSAGGHLALLAAYAPNHPELKPADVTVDCAVCGVVAFYPIVDLERAHHYFVATFDDWLGRQTTLVKLFGRVVNWYAQMLGIGVLIPPESAHYILPKIIPSLMGGPPEALPELYALASPVTHVATDNPPTLLLQGTHDLGGMWPRVAALHEALVAAGAPSVYVEFPFGNHIFDLILPRLSPAAQASTYDVERFLALMAADEAAR